jgi:23S rRNA (adenine2030-N6)-methyltransferase
VNYRHHYHAGNFADVWKHVLLVALVRGLQRKEKGFLYLDTHAGRGAYDLTVAAKGDSLTRQPEWPDGIGRLETVGSSALPEPIAEYVEIIRQFRERRTAAGTPVTVSNPARMYPGSPSLVQACLRPQDRMALYECQSDEHAVLQEEFAAQPRVRVERSDGYHALRACLPPPEKRALVLIDPPFEALDEFAQIARALEQGLLRLPAATFAVWYPLTERARSDAFLRELSGIKLPPCWVAELRVVGDDAGQKMKGCALLVLNPPWQLDQHISPALGWLTQTLAQSPAANSALRWLVPE